MRFENSAEEVISAQYCDYCMNGCVELKGEKLFCTADGSVFWDYVDTAPPLPHGAVCNCGKYEFNEGRREDLESSFKKPAHHDFEDLKHVPYAEREYGTLTPLEYELKTLMLHRAIGDWLTATYAGGDDAFWEENDEIEVIIEAFYLLENPNDSMNNVEDDRQVLEDLIEEVRESGVEI